MNSRVCAGLRRPSGTTWATTSRHGSHTLLDVCRSNAALFRASPLEGAALGMDRLRRTTSRAGGARRQDLYIRAGTQMVLDSFGRFDGTLVDLAQRYTGGPSGQRVRTGNGAVRSAGAFPAADALVLVNYHGKARDVSTLAHELGMPSIRC